MGYVEKADVHKLLGDPGLMDEVVNAVVSDPAAMTDLADDIADELSDLLEDDPTFKQKIVQAALATQAFKQRIVTQLINDLG